MSEAQTQTTTFNMTPSHWRALTKTGDAHKHKYGHAAIVSGPSGQGGAARLAARGALRIGAGVVSVVCAQTAVGEHAAQLNAIMVKPYSDAAEFGPWLREIDPQAICIGPNLGLGQSSRDVLMQALSLDLATCVDADAITLMAGAGSIAAHPKCVMTPHEGELRRFIPDVFAETTCRVRLAQAAAHKAGCCVLFKGVDTIVASPDHAPVIVSSKPYANASWLATAGSGDVLAGFITGLLARGFAPRDAACVAADLHLRCADAHGPGLIAEDLPEALPKVLSLM